MLRVSFIGVLRHDSYFVCVMTSVTVLNFLTCDEPSPLVYITKHFSYSLMKGINIPLNRKHSELSPPDLCQSTCHCKISASLSIITV